MNVYENQKPHQTTYLTNSQNILQYQIPINQNYQHNTNSEQTNLETIIQKNYPQNNIISDITKEKLNMLRATIELIKKLLNNRTQIKEQNIKHLNEKIMECRNYLINMDAWPILNNPLVETKRTNLGQTITRLETEKNQEETKCWNDQTKLYQELMKTITEYKAAHRRNKIINIT